MSGSRDIIQRRGKYLAPSFSLSYQEPLHIIRGEGQYLYDNNGKKYLDAVNNHDITFAVGPAGTGKTYQAVASAVSALKNKSVNNVKYLVTDDDLDHPIQTFNHIQIDKIASEIYNENS